MPRLMKGLRQRGRSFFFRIRNGGVDETISLGRDHDRAVVRALEINRRIKAGLPPLEERKAIFTVEDAVNSWLEDHVSQKRHGTFADQTRSRCERVLLPFMGSMRIDEVTAGTLFSYRNHVSGLTWGTDSRKEKPRKGRPAKAAPISETTVRMYLGDLRAVINHALTLQVIDRSPIPRQWLPKVEELAPDVLNKEEQAVLRGLPGDYGSALRLLLGTGIRWGELVRAQAQDVQGSRLVIRKSK